MGNISRANKVGEAELNESFGVGSMGVPLLLKALESSKQIEAPKKKVRFQVEDRFPSVDENNKSNGLVKFRIIVNREELGNIVDNVSNNSRYSSVEELLQGMKVTSRKISDVSLDDGKVSQKWKSELEFLAKKQ